MARLYFLARLNPKLWRLCFFAKNFDSPRNLAGYGAELRVRGDGKRYKFLITETKWDGTAYSYSFDTVSNSWMSSHPPLR